jgi:hypothetical protein
MVYGPGANPGVLKEQADMLLDIQQMLTTGSNAIGMPVTINIRGEANLRRDLYGSIKALSTPAKSFTIGAYPYQHQPSQRQLEKAGMKEHVDLIIWTAMKDWTDQSIDPGTFDLERCTVTADGRQWKIKDRAHQNEYGNQEAYMVLGLEHM